MQRTVQWFASQISESISLRSSDSGVPDDQIHRQRAHRGGFMEGRTRRSRPAMASNTYRRRSPPQASELGAPPFAAYFTVESLLLLLFLTASLLILPLVLPPLPPPPSLLLLLPVALLGVLVFLAFMPSDVRKIASSYL
ncbi:hypothetical protein BHE74_00051327 [Ensete ventricosum]|nr:hypothetical protein GW17_00017511 [Ensete ventricosum]RWW43051.1 hypothetical protein BHE74_00051327 [Ensete ventricosum]RZS24042.1 hypothetical protein BHM03_00057065 [Ensete ventricosum]